MAVENPSPSNVWGWGINDVNYGIYAFKYFKSSRWGARVSVDFEVYTILLESTHPKMPLESEAQPDVEKFRGIRRV